MNKIISQRSSIKYCAVKFSSNQPYHHPKTLALNKFFATFPRLGRNRILSLRIHSVAEMDTTADIVRTNSSFYSFCYLYG